VKRGLAIGAGVMVGVAVFWVALAYKALDGFLRRVP
jgi:hypothetical protein